MSLARSWCFRRRLLSTCMLWLQRQLCIERQRRIGPGLAAPNQASPGGARYCSHSLVYAVTSWHNDQQGVKCLLEARSQSKQAIRKNSSPQKLVQYSTAHVRYTDFRLAGGRSLYTFGNASVGLRTSCCCRLIPRCYASWSDLVAGLPPECSAAITAAVEWQTHCPAPCSSTRHVS